LFGDSELTLVVGDLLSAPTDVIVNPANGGLSHGGGLAGQIVLEGGEEIQQESSELVLKNGRLESGMATHTSAGRLPYKAIVHAVGPFMGRGLEKEKIHQAVISSLDICALGSQRSAPAFFQFLWISAPRHLWTQSTSIGSRITTFHPPK
jgi:O-acetyl-ADP-ribose deacetylase (regulator of RNase III)